MIYKSGEFFPETDTNREQANSSIFLHGFTNLVKKENSIIIRKRVIDNLNK